MATQTKYYFGWARFGAKYSSWFLTEAERDKFAQSIKADPWTSFHSTWEFIEDSA